MLYHVKVDFENKKFNTNLIFMNKDFTRILKFDILYGYLGMSILNWYSLK